VKRGNVLIDRPLVEVVKHAAFSEPNGPKHGQLVTIVLELACGCRIERHGEAARNNLIPSRVRHTC
jgi:hypothetical protein